jgi:hypothetical protein
MINVDDIKIAINDIYRIELLEDKHEWFR